MSVRDGYIPLKSLDELGNPIVERPIVLPDNRKFLVKMRGLTEAEMRAMRAKVPWPESPTDMVRNPTTKQVERVPLTSGPAYQQYQTATEEANGKLMKHCLLISLQVPVPGATEEEQVTYLENQLGSVALLQLMNHFNSLQMISAEDIEAAKNP